jgi:hypothetical protein
VNWLDRFEAQMRRLGDLDHRANVLTALALLAVAIVMLSTAFW